MLLSRGLDCRMFEDFHTGLSSFPTYVGFSDCTYDSEFKLQMSLKLSNIFLKHKDVIIQVNPDDGADCDYGAEDFNISGYPFKEFGYRCKTVSDILFGTLLSFKIERAVYEGFETDTEFALNAIMSDPASLKDLTVSIDEAKLLYLKTEKGSSLERACLAKTSANDLAKLITKKISNSYIYEMKVNKGARQFNVMVEIAAEGGVKTRLKCGLKYEADQCLLKLVTMY